MDGLRGLAIVMMIVDHSLGLIGERMIADSPVRIAMRLSMPLFALLMGYFLRPGRTMLDTGKFFQSRWIQIGLAAILVNAIFYPAYQCLDILCSFLLVMIVARFAGRGFPLFVLLVFAYPIDPTDGWPNGGWMDYPLTLVLGFAALGNLYRVYGRTAGLVVAALFAAFYPLATSWTPGSVSPLLLLFVFPATILLALAERFPRLDVRWVAAIGRHPLKVYVIQYYVITAIAFCV